MKKEETSRVKKLQPKIPTMEDRMVELSPGKLKKGGKLLNQDEINGIITLARNLSNDPLLVDLIKEVESIAAKKIYFESKSLEELHFGKGMLYSLDLLKQKIINAAKIKT